MSADSGLFAGSPHVYSTVPRTVPVGKCLSTFPYPGGINTYRLVLYVAKHMDNA